MGDSDEDFDRRKSRDKFRRERSDYEARGRVMKRDMYDDRSGRGGSATGGGDFGGKRYAGNYRDRNSPGQSEPPLKRSRREWGDEGGYRRDNREEETQPAMMTFKKFLHQQDDNISDEMAMTKYKEYKEEFFRQQLDDFFKAHKLEEWFREKYHPDFAEKRSEAIGNNIRRRLNVFMELMAAGWTDNKRVHIDHSEDLVKFMDAVVIKLEGGTDEDLKILDRKDIPEPVPRSNMSIAVGKKETKQTKDKGKDDKKKAKKHDASDSSDDDDDSSYSSSSSSSSSESEGEEKEEGGIRDRKKRRKSKSVGSVEGESAARRQRPRENSDTEEGEEKKDAEKEMGELAEDIDDDAPTPTTAETAPEGANREDTDRPSTGPAVTTEARKQNGAVDENEPRPLHKTNSIFLRTLNADISRAEIEGLCKSYAGFIRLALHDPASDRNFTRRGWVTFDRSVNIKEICWNLNNIRLKGCDLGAIVNRELIQRARPIMVLANHKPVMRQDIKFAARMIQKLDSRHGLWQQTAKPEGEGGETTQEPGAMAYSFTSENPLLENITDYLVDEGSYEEEALLGGCLTGSNEGSSSDITIENDEELMRVLDRMILYLRVVHSLDYYSATEYPHEDAMPHRCGIVHARGAHIQPDKRITQRDVDEYMKAFEAKVSHLLESVERLPNKEAKKLGMKDLEAATEAFIQANTQELGKDRWLCPLSGKKFKGPDFVRKHILNKHMDRVDEEKKETEFFNNYIRDPNRPQLPEHPSNRTGPMETASLASPGPGSRDFGDRSGQGRGGDYGRGYGGGYPYRDYYDHPRGGGGGGSYYGNMPMREHYRSPPPMPYPQRDYYRTNSGSYDRMDNRSGGNYYRKPYGGYGAGKPYGGRPYQRGGYNRKMLSYTDLDAPTNDD